MSQDFPGFYAAHTDDGDDNDDDDRNDKSQQKRERKIFICIAASSLLSHAHKNMHENMPFVP